MSEPDVSDLLTVAQAIAVIDGVEVRPRVIELPLEQAQGLILAASIGADRDDPPFDKSLMDGFAVRCDDVRAAPVELTVTGEIAAGGLATRPVGPGQAHAIMTGAPMPPGADGVVPVEDTVPVGEGGAVFPSPTGRGQGEGAFDDQGRTDESRSSDARNHPHSPLSQREREREKIRILRGTTPGRYIAKKGSNVTAGSTVLPAGTRLGPAQIAVAASVGAARVNVFARPRVAVLSTGDELVGIDQTPGPAQIRNSNSAMLGALLRTLGCDVTDLGVTIDQRDAIRAAIEHGLEHDVLFVSGGMSMGRYDHVPIVLRELGAQMHITKLRIKPGKPFVFATVPLAASRTGAPASAWPPAARQQKFIFGLPGNPVSGFVCTLRLAARLVQRLGGASVHESWVTGPLLSPLEQNGPREFHQPAIVSERGIQPLKWKGSADVYTLAAANGLLVRVENEPALPAGATVRVLQLPG